MSTYQAFLVHLSPRALDRLAALLRIETREPAGPAAYKWVAGVNVELESLACEIEARLQHHAAGLTTFKDVL